MLLVQARGASQWTPVRRRLPVGSRVLQGSATVVEKFQRFGNIMLPRLLLLGLLTQLASCSIWHATEASSPIRLPNARMRSTSVGLEVATVTLQPEQQEWLTEIFSELDEQPLASAVRARLAQNGLRAGTLGTRIPESINLLLIEAADRRKHPTAENQSYGDELRFVQCRADSPVATDLWGIRDLAFASRFETMDLQETIRQAQCQLSLTASPKNGGAQLHVVPEIVSGPMRQRYVVQDNAFHLEAGRDVRAFKELAVDVFLQPGEIFLMTNHQWPEDSLGKALFDVAGRQKVMLVRLAQTQTDDLFVP